MYTLLTSRALNISTLMHELIVRISFAKEQRIFDPVIIEGKEVELVTSTKLLGPTTANDLSWNGHVTEITKKG